MDTTVILQELEAQIQRLKRARELLSGGTSLMNGDGNRPEQKSGRSRRSLSEDARQRIIAAQKRRWAAHRKATKKAANEAAT